MAAERRYWERGCCGPAVGGAAPLPVTPSKAERSLYEPPAFGEDNEAHKNWLDHVMDGVTFGVLAEGSVQADSQMVEKIKYYFTSTVKEAQRVLHADVPDEEDEDNKEEDVDDSDSDEDSKA